MTLLELVVAIIVALAPPTRCPPGWSLAEGVRRNGEFACYAPLPKCCGDARGPCEAVACPRVEVTRSRIYCTNGTQPIVVDHRTVGCQRQPTEER